MGSFERVVAVVLVIAVVASTSAAAISAGVLGAEVTGPAVATETLSPDFDRQVIAGDSPTSPGELGTWVWAGEQPTMTVEVGAPVFDEESREYRRYTVRVTETRIERFGPTAESLGERTVTLGELGSESVEIELAPDAFTRSERTDSIRLVTPERTIEVKRATVHVGIYPDGGAELWNATAVEVAVIRKAGDLDGDGLSNGREMNGPTHFLHGDGDGDDLTDGTEVNRFGTDPMQTDTDGDGITDPREIRRGTDPTGLDTDGDGLTDPQEIEAFGTDPTRADTDGDGLDDLTEIQRGTDPTTADTDGDGLGDATEIQLGTDPTLADTDGDGVSDAWEVERYDTNPTDPGDVPADGGATTNQSGAEGTPDSGTASIDGLTGDTVDGSSLPAPLDRPLESGSVVPFAAVAVGLGLRRVVAWVSYP